MIRRLAAAAGGVTALVTLAACAGTPTPVPPAPQPQVTTAPSPAPTCDNATASYAPGPLPNPNALPAGSTMQRVRQRGRLIVGVSADSYLLGSRNPATGQIEGFDIDIAHQIAKAIFGPDAQAQLRVISAADRIPLLKSHEIDLVVRNMTMTCDRWNEIAFSAEYYRSGQKLLASKGSTITGPADLADRRVCAPQGTSSLAQIQQLSPKAIPVAASTHTECLVLFREGKVEAITGDDTVLAGLAAQDPYAVVLPGPTFTQEPYGVGVPADQIDMAKFVNAVLERMRADGRWRASYDRWLRPTLGEGAPPAPVYGRAG